MHSKKTVKQKDSSIEDLLNYNEIDKDDLKELPRSYFKYPFQS